MVPCHCTSGAVCQEGATGSGLGHPAKSTSVVTLSPILLGVWTLSQEFTQM